MPQTGTDKQGRKVRWDENKRAWVPVETGKDKSGNPVWFDGENWNQFDKPKEKPVEPGTGKIKTAPAKRPFLEALKDVNWSRGGKVPGPRQDELEMKSFKDIAQAVGSVVSGAAAFPVATAISASLQTPGAGKITLPPEAAEAAGNRVGGAITIKPTTPGAAAGSAALGTPFAPFSAAIQAMPNAQTRTALATLMLIAPYAKGMTKGFINARIKSGKGASPAEIKAILKTTEVPKEVSAKVAGESTAPKAMPKAEVPKVDPATLSPEQQLVESLKQSKEIQPQQKALYKQERGRRVGEIGDISPSVTGQARFYAKKGVLKGELPKVDFEPLNLSQAAKDALHDQIHYSKALRELEKVGTADALERMFNGKFPAKHEVQMMNKVFGGELMDALMREMSTRDKIWYWGGQIANIPRTLMASFDLSAPLRQGIFVIGRPKQFFGSFKGMFKSFAKEANYSKVMSEIASRPTYELMRESGLDITAVKSSLKAVEEPFMGGDIIARGGKWAEKNIPVAGKAFNLIPRGIEASQRAYTAFLNKLRADVFDSITSRAKDVGLYDIKGKGGETIQNLNSNPKLSEDIAWYINAATGRGRLPDIVMKSSDILNSVFFSPRLMSSRLTLLNPATYLNPSRSSFVRVEALGDFAKFYAIYTTTFALALLAGKEHVGGDPRSADFGKIKVGNTRIDLGGGFGQYVRTATQASLPLLKALGILDEAELISSKTGKRTKIGGGFNETSVREILIRFFSQKQSPIFSLVWDTLGQRNSEGKPIKIGDELRKRITPMIADDIIAASKDDPNQLKAVIVGFLVMLGAGAQTYGPTAEKTFLDQSGKPYQGGDKVIDELNRLGIRTGIGTKAVKGQPIPEEDIAKILKDGGDEARKRFLFYMDNPAYKKATDAQKKEWLQNAIEATRRAAKKRYVLGVK